MKAFTSTAAPGSVAWLGLGWVYSGGFWVVVLLLAAAVGWPAGAAAAALRLGLTLATGVGLCAMERWGWAAALCSSALHAAAAGSIAVAGGTTLLTLPGGTLSWTPIFWGLNTRVCALVTAAAAGVAVTASLSLWVLWREQQHFDIPPGRPFSLLSRFGPWLATPILAADTYLLCGWWLQEGR
jgi:hypothetical protein